MDEMSAGSDLQRLDAAVRRLASSFRAAGLDTPELDARILVAHAVGLPRSALLTSPAHALDAQAIRAVASFEDRRLAREPVSRILGYREFMGLTLEIGPATLDPRPETETLVEAALGLVRAGQVCGDAAPRILDLGTGSGAILLALLSALPNAMGTGADTDPAALAVAQRNANRLRLADRARFEVSDWVDDVGGRFDLVVSNPPYIASCDISDLDPEVARYDPRLALDGGEDGLYAYRAIAKGVHRVLHPRGWLLLEIGLGQAKSVCEICLSYGLELNRPTPHIIFDLGARPRCVAVRPRQ